LNFIRPPSVHTVSTSISTVVGAVQTSPPLGAGPRAKKPTINVNIGDVPDELRRHYQLYLVKTLNAVQRCCPHERNCQSHLCSENPVSTLPWVPPTPGASRGDRSGPFPRLGNVCPLGTKTLRQGLQAVGGIGASSSPSR